MVGPWRLPTRVFVLILLALGGIAVVGGVVGGREGYDMISMSAVGIGVAVIQALRVRAWRRSLSRAEAGSSTRKAS